MLVPTCNSECLLSPGSIEDRQAAFCEKIRREVLEFRIRGYHGVGSECRAGYETLTGGKETCGFRERIGGPNVLSRLRQLGDPAVLRGGPARPPGDVPEKQRRVGGHGDVALQGRQLHAGPRRGRGGGTRALREDRRRPPPRGGEHG